jgi:hypothetical protein
VIGFRRAAISLLISTILFAGFTILAFMGLFDLVETRFYHPAAARAMDREIDADTRVIEELLAELQGRFAATLDDEAVMRSFLSSQGSDDIARRADLYGKLQESLGGLQSVRFIDSGGVRIHFSTWPPDILIQDQNSVVYRNYNAAGNNAAAYIPFGQVEAAERQGPRLILDEAGERIVFSHPLKDSYGVYQGTALFSLSVRAVMDRMTAAGRIKIGEDIAVISEPPGILIGLPPSGRKALLPLVARVWSENTLSLGRLNSGMTEASLELVSRRAKQNLYVGRLVNESLLIFPPAMRSILLVCFFVTVYLFIFLLISLRQDDMTIVQSRLKKLRVKLLEEYYERKGTLDRERWKKELEQRREDVRSELKRGLRAKTGILAEIDDFIDKSWDDLMTITGGRTEDRIDEDKLRTLLKRSLAESLTPPSPKALDEAPETGAGEPEELETLDEAEAPESEAGEPEELETLDEAEAPEDGTGEPELAAEFLEIDPLGFEIAEELEETALNDLASVLEFTPDPEEEEREKDEAARSLAEQFEIQSPFAEILSTLSTVEFEPEPMESLESLEHEGLIEDDAPETEAEELERGFTGIQFSIPFLTAPNNEITLLEAEDLEDAEEDGDAPAAAEDEGEKAAETGEGASGPVVAEKDGVTYINESVLNPDQKTLKGLDRNFKDLIDSILNRD